MDFVELRQFINNHVWIVLTTIVTLVIFGLKYLEAQVDPNEPPKHKTSIPILGHLIGIMSHGALYHKKLDDEYQLPIYTITIFSHKSYVITDPNLAQVAIRHKNFSFDPIGQGLGAMLEGLTQDSLKAMKAESTNENENNYSQDNNKMTHESLKPGPQLDKVVSRALKKISSGLDGIGPRFEDNNLFLWIRDIFTSAITYSFFGSNDPFLQDPTLVQSFWDYENDVSALMFAPLPWLSARHAYLARERVQASLRAFFNKKYHLENDCSLYARGRIEVALKHGFTTTEAANVLIGIIFVSTINTIPTAYWLLIYILSDASLSSDLLEEVESIASRNGDKCVLDIDNITVKCPVLVSAYQEVMRLTNHQTGLRQVMEDTQLTYEPVYGSFGDSPKVPTTYLLRKGCFVQTPAAVLHASTAAWGPDVASFNPRRFLPSSITSKQKKSFVPFGGGRHLCPGRHLAFSEILGTVAMLLLGYEVQDISGGAVQPQAGWKLKIVDGVPRPNSAHLGKGFKDVKVRRKKRWENVSWVFRIGGAEF